MSARFRTVILVALGWLMLSIITASQTVLTYLATGGQVRLAPVLIINLALWLPWAALSPVILAAARRWPLYGPGWPRRALLHLALNVSLAVVAALLYRGLRLAFALPVRGNYALVLVSSLNTALLVYWGLVALTHALAYYRRAEERDRLAAETSRQLTQARLDALRSQIHPHFLFNTLHAIASRVREDPRGAEDMLGTLGDLLRVNLSAAGGEETTLREELTLIERYVAIQRVRLGDRLRVDVRVSAGAEAVKVPTLILQPLVENAIEHGIAQRITGGTLQITAGIAGDRLRLSVADDDDRTDGDAPWRVGLTNTRDRLQALHGDRQSFHATRRDGRFIVEITLPAGL